VSSFAAGKIWSCRRRWSTQLGLQLMSCTFACALAACMSEPGIILWRWKRVEQDRWSPSRGMVTAISDVVLPRRSASCMPSHRWCSQADCPVADKCQNVPQKGKHSAAKRKMRLGKSRHSHGGPVSRTESKRWSPGEGLREGTKA
jgi:hypothetical protein